jgi:hypothetical protein
VQLLLHYNNCHTARYEPHNTVCTVHTTVTVTLHGMSHITQSVRFTLRLKLHTFSIARKYVRTFHKSCEVTYKIEISYPTYAFL